MKEIEFFDTDFLGNKIDIGDNVIFEAPKYRDFAIGTVISKAAKSCQIEYINDWNYPSQGRKDVVRQCYGQLIKYPFTKKGKWIPKEVMIRSIDALNHTCSECGVEGKHTNYCPNCGTNMMEDSE